MDQQNEYMYIAYPLVVYIQANNGNNICHSFAFSIELILF